MNSQGISAILGPTNTGKTYIAMQRMLSSNSGIMGFPLRLLARENYDKAVAEKGLHAVALVTGEEKIIPKQARYYICTVEAMPLDMAVEFIGIDEIQLCGDPERGHIFTDRLLNCRGRLETVFLGAETIRNLLVRLIPDIYIETRPRFSQLTYIAPKRLSRVPRRSAIVVFSAAEVYRVAEELRQHRGGCAVVLGALSPRTRNAQVDMYQSGEVDYMVATDAIGMGLNMDLDHVTFARTRKFDGRQARGLSLGEIAQIAGRAGRHMNDGTFSTTTEVGGFDDMTVEAVENHRFDPLKALIWRSRDLDFSHASALVRSLDKRPPSEVLMRARDAEDLVALKQLLGNEDIRTLAKGPAAVRILWDVAGVPDFRKTMTDAHHSLLTRLYRFLMTGTGKIPEDFIDGYVSGLDDLKGDIDTLINRIANIRTWTFISHRADWVTNPRHWQEKSKKIDDRLSDALHDRLTQRFVDRRAAILVRSLVNGEELSGKVEKDGSVVIEGQVVGSFKGFSFTPDPSIMDAHAKPILTAARKTLVDEVEKRLAMVLADNDGAFRLLEDGAVLWREVPMGHLAKGPNILEPTVAVIASDLLEPAARDRIRDRLAAWIKAHLKNRLAPYFQLQNASLAGASRGLAFQLIENLGLLRRDDVADLVKSLSKDERKALYDQNVRIGRYAIWVKGLTNPAHWPWRALLWGIWHAVTHARELLPSAETNVVEMPKSGWGQVGPEFYAMLGYVPVELYNPRGRPHRVYVRVDALDQVSNSLWSASDTGPFELPGGLAERLACSDAMMKRIVNALGFKRGNERDIERALERLKQRQQREEVERAKKAAQALERQAKEAARKAELLAREVVAAESLALDSAPSDAAAATATATTATAATADVDAAATDDVDAANASIPEASTDPDAPANAANAAAAVDEVVQSRQDLGVESATGSPETPSEPAPEPAPEPEIESESKSDPAPESVAQEPALLAETSPQSEDTPETDPKPASAPTPESNEPSDIQEAAQKELWVRVFRKPGQAVPEGTARPPRGDRKPARDTQERGGRSGRPNRQRQDADTGGTSGAKARGGDKANRANKAGKESRGSSNRNPVKETKIDENNPFAVLATLKTKKK